MKKITLITILSILALLSLTLVSCQIKEVQLELVDYQADYSVGSPIDIENHYKADVRTGITASVVYNDGEKQEKTFTGNIYWPIVGGEHTFTISIGKKSVSFTVQVGYREPTISVDESPFVYRVGSTVYFEDLLAVKNPSVYPSDATLKFKDVKYRSVETDLDETIGEWEDADYDTHDKCFDVTKAGEYLLSFEACLGDKSAESSFTVVAVTNKNDGNENVLTYNEKYASKNVITSSEDSSIFRLPASSDYTEASFVALNHKFNFGEALSVTFKGKNLPQIGLHVTPNEQSSNPFGLFSAKAHVLSFEYKGTNKYVLMGPNGFNSNAVKIAVESRGEFWGWDDLEANKYYRVSAWLNKRNATTYFVSYNVYEIQNYGTDNQSETLIHSLEQSGWSTSEGEINEGYFVLYGSKNKSITFKVEYGDKQVAENIVANSISLNNGSTTIEKTCKNNNDNTIQGGYLAYTNKYGLNTSISFDFVGKNIPNVCFFADNASGATDGKGLYLSTDGSDLAVYGPKRLAGDVLAKEANSQLARNKLVDGKAYRYTIIVESGGSYKVKFTLRLDEVTDDCLLGVAQTSLTAAYLSNSPKGAIIVYGTTSSRLTFNSSAPTEYVEPTTDIDKLSFSNTDLAVLRDSETNITLNGELADSSDIVWSIADGSIATLNDGKLIAQKVGNTTLTATANGFTASCNIQVVEKLYFKKATLRVVIGEADTQLILLGTGEKGTITWATDSDCLTVSDSGVISAVSEGVAKVTATATSVYGTEVAECVVTVALPVIHFEEAEKSIRLYSDETLALQYSDGKTISWYSSDENVVTVQNGVVSAVGVGTATITATATNGETDSCKIVVINILHNATYNKTTGQITLKQDASGTAYSDSAYVQMGNYADGAFVVMEFTGKNLPQIQFFASGATNKLVDESINGLLFSSDVATADYRMFSTTNPNQNAIMASSWDTNLKNYASSGAWQNLDESKNYVLIVGCLRDESKYYLTFKLYIKNDDGTVSLAQNGSFTKDYSVLDTNIKTSGNEIVVYGSRNADLDVTVKVVSTLEEAESMFTIAE